MYELLNGTNVTLDEGPERDLFICLLEEVWDDKILRNECEEGECCEWTEVPLLNRLEDYHQQGYLFYLVGRAFLDKSFIVRKSAWADAALFYILKQATLHRWDETMDRLLVAIVAKSHEEKMELLAGLDQNRWFRLDFLEGRYLARYFSEGGPPILKEDMVMDAEPAKSKALKQAMGVDPNYFTSLAPYPSPEEMQTAMEWMAEVAAEAKKIRPDLLDGC